jgi:hypothetical protein
MEANGTVMTIVLASGIDMLQGLQKTLTYPIPTGYQNGTNMTWYTGTDMTLGTESPETTSQKT